jgi:uncharacterized protein
MINPTSRWTTAACLAVALPAMTELSAQAQTGPGVDCAKPTGPVEKLICKDQELASLDRKMADLYTQAVKSGKGDADQNAAHSTWLASRDACAKEKDPRTCVQSSYQRRVVELQIKSGLLKAPKPVGYICGGLDPKIPFTASFYKETEPPSAVVSYGTEQVIAILEPAASGAKYAAPDFEFWTHQSDALLTRSGKQHICKGT